MTTLRPINEYDILKSFAIILVVIGHITILFTPETYPKYNVKTAQFITFGIYLFHMPLFMAISGAVYQLSKGKQRYQSFFPFIKTKFKRIIIPYLFVGLFVMLPVLVYLNKDVLLTDFHTYAKILLAEDCRHLWYLLALFWIFIFQFIADKLKTNLYCLFLLSSILTLSLSYLVPNFNFLRIQMAFREWPSFILGMIMARNADKMTFNVKSVFFLSGGFLICSTVILISENYIIDMIFSLIFPYFICIALILISRQLVLSKNMANIVRFTTGYSFGIYLFHVMIIYLMRHWLDNIVEMWNLIALMFVGAILISISTTWMLRKLKLSFIIGE